MLRGLSEGTILSPEQVGWRQSNGVLSDYDAYFRSVIQNDSGPRQDIANEGSSASLVDAERGFLRPDGSNNVLDLCAYPYFLRSLENHHFALLNGIGVSVALSETRDWKTRLLDNLKNIHQVTGSVFKDETWDKIMRRMPKGGRQKFNLVTMAPVGALNEIHEFKNPEEFWKLLQHALQVVEPGGNLLTQIPNSLEPVMQQWVDNLNNSRGESLKAIWCIPNPKEGSGQIGGQEAVLRVQVRKDINFELPRFAFNVALSASNNLSMPTVS